MNGDGAWGGWQEHPLRSRVLGEVHARPFRGVSAPRAFLHFAFQTPPDAAAADREALAALCRRHGAAEPAADRKVHQVDLAGGTLRWEQFSEFTTWTFDQPIAEGSGAFPSVGAGPLGDGFQPPGRLMVATRLDIVSSFGSDGIPGGPLGAFDDLWVSASMVAERRALIVSDFRVGADGLSRILVVDRDLGDRQAGPLVQRLLELETYRSFALLGLPAAQEQAARIGGYERRLVEITAAIRASAGLEENRSLLASLSALSADIEAEVAETAYRFGASRAYDGIVAARLDALDEVPFAGCTTWRAFLTRRTAPAMRTMATLEHRLHELAAKIGRAANLLRTRVDVELEQQNRDLLDSMNRRARLALRLQQTVEGLSVAAVSYYVVGLVGYLAKGVGAFGFKADPGYVTAAAVGPALLAVWWLVRRIRRSHAGEDHA